jgi:hypothetical protein
MLGLEHDGRVSELLYQAVLSLDSFCMSVTAAQEERKESLLA